MSEVSPSRVVVLNGNPRPGSRTLAAARTIAQPAADDLGVGPVLVVETHQVGASLFSAVTEPPLRSAMATVTSARVLVVATPVYKGSYTGQLKSFLDLLAPQALRSVVAIPVVVCAAPAHRYVSEVFLRPLLLELGAAVPTSALAVTEAELAQLPQVAQTWWSANRHLVLADPSRPLAANTEGNAST